MTIRPVLLILLLVNAVAFYWFRGQQAQREVIQQTRSSAVELAGVAQLRLLGETVAQPVASAKGATADNGENCFVLGPISEKEIGGLSKGLQETGVDFTAQARTREEVSGYWVYLPPFADRGLAQEKLNELRERGIDSFVFEDGELENGISLGIFSSSENASQRKDELYRLGYRSKVRAATRNVKEHWLEFALEWKVRLSQRFWDDLRELAAKAEVMEKPCQAVASSGDFQ